MLCYTILDYTILCYTILYYTIAYYSIVCGTLAEAVGPAALWSSIYDLLLYNLVEHSITC